MEQLLGILLLAFTVILLAALRYVQSLRRRLQGSAPARALMKSRDHDPGQLTDDDLRKTLASPRAFLASKTLDRVQDAFDRLIEERERTLRGLGLCERTDGWTVVAAGALFRDGHRGVFFTQRFDAEVFASRNPGASVRAARLFREIVEK